MSSPPSYNHSQTKKSTAQPPPYKASHQFANSTEELAALKEWAQTKPYVTPGADGTLPAMDRGGYGIKSMAWGGPMQGSSAETQPKGSVDMAERIDALREIDEDRKRKEEVKSRKGSISQRIKRRVQGRGKEAGEE